MGKFSNFLSHTWNSFMNKDPTYYPSSPIYGGTSVKADRITLTRGNERTIINSIYNRIAIDVASNTFQHVKNDKNGRFVEVIDDGVNQCLNIEANIDQCGRQFIQDLVLSCLDEGNVAAVPIKGTFRGMNEEFGNKDINNLRVGKIIEWYPQHVRLEVYDEKLGRKVQVVYHKRNVAIIENPFYSVMNEPNSITARLLRKLALMDIVDERNYSGKLGLIIQLPYSTKTDLQRNRADKRLKDIQDQLTDSPYGIAYIDATEKVVQLNKSLENNFMKQIEYFQNMLYSQLGITQTIMDNTANEETMQNYLKRTVEPICAALVNEFRRKFLTKTARTQGQSFAFFADPFKGVPATKVADLADKLTRNEILTSNEVRQSLGFKPSNDPNADVLINKNINHGGEGEGGILGLGNQENEDYDTSMQQLDDIDRQIKELEAML